MSDEQNQNEEEFEEQETEEQEAEEQETKGVDNPIRKIALDMGWKDEEQFSGDPDDFVDAETYIRRGADIQDTMRKHIKEQNKKLNKMTFAIEKLQSHNETVYEAEVARLEKEVKALKTERRAAIEDGDVDRVEDLDEQIQTLSASVKKEQNEPSPNHESDEVYQEWLGKNQWYIQDKEMADYADAQSDKYKGAPYERMLSRVAADVKAMFPEKFPEKKQRPASKSSSVEAPTSSTRNRAYTRSDLTPEQKEVMDTFIQLGVMDEKKFISDLAKKGEIGGQQ